MAAVGGQDRMAMKCRGSLKVFAEFFQPFASSRSKKYLAVCGAAAKLCLQPFVFKSA